VSNVGEWNIATDMNNRVSLASLAGKPMIAYFDENDAHLYFSTFYELP
jgi:hypothetical protein